MLHFKHKIQNSPVPLPDLELIVSCVPPQELDILGGQSHALAGPLVPPEPLPMAPGTWGSCP